MSARDDASTAIPKAPTDEPALTQQNSGAVAGEKAAAEETPEASTDGSEATPEASEPGSTRTQLGVIPSSYGAPGGTTGGGRNA